MSKIETDERGVYRDVGSKALLPSPKSKAYQEYKEKRALADRVNRLEAIVEQLAEKLK